MHFNPITQKIEISPQDATAAYRYLRNALRHIREQGGRTLDRHERPGPMDHTDFAGRSILDAAARLGITMGVDWPEELDLRDM